MSQRFLFRYPGSKSFIADKVNAILSKVSFKRWVEPFCGSAALFYNLEKQFDDALLNDLDKRVVGMHQACKDFDYMHYLGLVDSVDRKYGNFRTDKEAYYSFRSWYNEDGCRTSLDSLYLIYLSSMCINSMLRFGPNGMNQGWGRRKAVIKEADWNVMHEKLQHASFSSVDYRSVPIRDRSIVFLDPPYESKENTLYGKGFSQDEFIEWLLDQKASHSRCLWMYTDVETEKSDALLSKGFKKIVLRDMKTIAPSKEKKEADAIEVMYIGLSK
jgi:DNA adenine methylase Dam